MKRKTKNTYHYYVLVFFGENVEITLERLSALAGLEITGSRFVRKPACDSFEPGFLDGMLLSFLDPKEPCSFGAPWENSVLFAGAVEKDAPPFPSKLHLPLGAAKSGASRFTADCRAGCAGCARRFWGVCSMNSMSLCLCE